MPLANSVSFRVIVERLTNPEQTRASILLTPRTDHAHPVPSAGAPGQHALCQTSEPEKLRRGCVLDAVGCGACGSSWWSRRVEQTSTSTSLRVSPASAGFKSSSIDVSAPTLRAEPRSGRRTTDGWRGTFTSSSRTEDLSSSASHRTEWLSETLTMARSSVEYHLWNGLSVLKLCGRMRALGQ